MPTITHTPDTPENRTITDIGQYVHEIIEDNNKLTIEAKDPYNQALITNTELDLTCREALDHGLGTIVSELWDLRLLSY